MEENCNFFYCYDCDKPYSSQSSLCHHNKIYHSDKNCETEPETEPKKINKCLTCDFCHKIFKFTSGKCKHTKICKERIRQEEEKKRQEEERINKEKYDLVRQEIELKKMDLKVEKEKQKTLQLELKISKNKQIINNINNGTVNNITNVFNFNSVESENFCRSLINSWDANEQYKFLDYGYKNGTDYSFDYIIYLVEQLYCGQYPELSNIFISNIKSGYANIIKNGKNSKEEKNIALKTLIKNNKGHSNLIYENFKKTELYKNLNDSVKLRLDTFNKIFNKTYVNAYNEDCYDNEDGIVYKDYIDFNLKKIENILYINKEKITKHHKVSKKIKHCLEPTKEQQDLKKENEEDSKKDSKEEKKVDFNSYNSSSSSSSIVEKDDEKPFSILYVKKELPPLKLEKFFYKSHHYFIDLETDYVYCGEEHKDLLGTYNRNTNKIDYLDYI